MEPSTGAPTAGETDLLAGIRNDEPGAFERFVARFGDDIFGFGLRMCGEREDARDVLQDTLLRAFTSLKDLRHPGAMRAWVYRVAANACLMKRRRGKFEPRQMLSLEELMPRFTEGGLPEIPDASALPDEALRRSEIQRVLRRAVEALPPHYRVVLVMRDMQGLSTQEVVDALGLPETAVKMRLHRARLMVRRSLEEAAGPGGREGTPR
jgi:RNA polymerase sigma-70 factor (ECF subfamily)